MAGFNWGDYEEDTVSKPSRSSAQGFNWDQYAVDKAEPSTAESVLRGASQGASLGFSDELAGALGSLGYKAGLASAPRIKSTHPEAQAKIEQIADQNTPDLADIYRQGRDEERALNEAARKANPVAFGAGELGGATANPIAAGAASLRGGAALGGIMGLGQSESDVTRGNILNPAQDVAMGAAGGALFPAVGKAISPMLPHVIPERGTIGRKLGTLLTGVPERELQTYAAQTGAINKMIKESGGDLTVAADAVREKLQAGLRKTKDNLNKQISEVLNNASPQKTIPLDPIINKLQLEKAKLNPNLHEEAVSQLDDIIGKVAGEADDKGNVNLKSLQDIKMYLMDKAKGSYLKGGQLFSTASEAANAAKRAATTTLEVLNPLAPEIQKANKQLQQLHFIEGNLNKNLIAAGKPEAALLAAGSADASRNRTMLKKLGELTNQNALGEAEKLAAARTFANPSYSPVDTTGKSAFRLMTASGIGGAVGGVPGAIAAGALTSPAMTKMAINIADLARDRLGTPAAKKVFGKFAPALELAKQRGPQALAVTSAMLASDPEFKEKIKDFIPQ
jgi:ribosomal protein S13